MPEVWFIDGYNLLYDLTSQKTRKGLSRRDLLDKLAGFAAASDRHMTVVFDGRGPEEEWAAFRTDRLEVVYSQAVTADAYIERRVTERRETPGTVVVTRDNAIACMARGAGARVFAPKEFLELLLSDEKGRDETLFRERVRYHGFNRPFDGKLKDK